MITWSKSPSWVPEVSRRRQDWSFRANLPTRVSATTVAWTDRARVMAVMRGVPTKRVSSGNGSQLPASVWKPNRPSHGPKLSGPAKLRRNGRKSGFREVKYCAPTSAEPPVTRFAASLPPGPRLFSKTVTSWPRLRNWIAAVSPARPEPTIAIRRISGESKV